MWDNSTLFSFLLLISQLPWDDVFLLLFCFLFLPSLMFICSFLRLLMHFPWSVFSMLLFVLFHFSASYIFSFLKICALPVLLILSSCTLLLSGILLLCGSRWAGERRFLLLYHLPSCNISCLFPLPTLTLWSSNYL